MRNPVLRFASLVICIAIGLAGCGILKDLLNKDIQQFNQDSNEYKSTLDQTDYDITEALRNVEGFGKTDGGSSVVSSPLCGVTIDDSTEIDQNIVYFNFDGVTECFSPSRTRSGQIKVELLQGNNWDEMGAVIKQTFIDYKITRSSDGKFIKFNGEKILENMNSHNWIALLAGLQTFSHRERALNIDVEFSNNQFAVWNSARVTEWGYVPSETKITFRATGDTTLNGQTLVDSWGVNRYAQDFTTYYNQDITSDSYCGLWRFTSGELVHMVNGNSYILTLGVNQQGNPTTGTCGYGYKVSWEVNGDQHEQVFSY